MLLLKKDWILANQNHSLILLISFEVKKLYRKMVVPIICKELLS
jgi:hypothetical protein